MLAIPITIRSSPLVHPNWARGAWSIPKHALRKKKPNFQKFEFSGLGEIYIGEFPLKYFLNVEIPPVLGR
jgi:hypothetical protein